MKRKCKTFNINSLVPTGTCVYCGKPKSPDNGTGSPTICGNCAKLMQGNILIVCVKNGTFAQIGDNPTVSLSHCTGKMIAIKSDVAAGIFSIDPANCKSIFLEEKDWKMFGFDDSSG